MSNISSLFSTPEQGRRLAELVPDIESFFVWESFHIEGMSQPKYLLKERRKSNAIIDLSTLKYPALTLQELRDYAYTADFVKYGDTSANGKWFAFGVLVRTATAPELAAWVIERLEELK